MQNTVIICLTVCIVVAMATRPCCMPEEYEGQMYISSLAEVKGNIYRNFEIANITVNYNRGLAVVKQNSIHGRVHVLVDYNGYTYASVNGTCVYKEKTTAKQQSRCIICDKGNYIGSSYFGAGDNILSLDTYHFKYDKYVSDDGATLQNVSMYMSVTEVEEDVIVPVEEMGEFSLSGAKVDISLSFVNFKIEVEDEQAFDVPASCQQSHIIFRRSSPRLMKTSNAKVLTEILPKVSQEALAFISIA